MTRPLSIAVRLTGGMGDVLLASTYLEALHAALERVEITAYYHSPAIAEFVYAGARFVHAIRPVEQMPIDKHAIPARRGHMRPAADRGRADVIAYTGHFPRLVVQDPDAVARYGPELRPLVEISAAKMAGIPNLIAQHPRLDGLWARIHDGTYLDGLGQLSGLPISRRSFPFLALDPAAFVMPLAARSIETGRFITVHDGFDNRQPVEAGKATKQWPLEHWTRLVRQLHERLPGFAIVQLGAGKSRKIDGVDVQLVNATSLAETAWLIKRAALHIDTDSGLAHLAYALHTPAVVLFGPTPARYFGHEPHAAVEALGCRDCWWSTPDWLAKCPRGLETPVCMSSISPVLIERVAVLELNRVQRPTYVVSALRPYDGMAGENAREDQEIADAIACAAGLTPGPITGHLVDPMIGVYVHASKQWEYAYAFGAIRIRPGEMTGLRIADVGGGRGAFAAYLASRGAVVEQFDRDYEWSRGRTSEAGYRAYSQRKGYRARYGSIYNLPAESDAYDVVLCISVLEHLPQKPEALRELLRLVRPGGICVLTFDLALEPERFNDRLRVGVADPVALATWLDAVGVTMHWPPNGAITDSIAQIQRDGVAGIPDGMTVAGLTITRTA